MADPQSSYFDWFIQTYFPDALTTGEPDIWPGIWRLYSKGDNQYRRYWEQYIKAPELAPEEVKKNDEARKKEILESILQNATSVDQLDDLLDGFQQAKLITKAQGDDYYDRYYDKVNQNFLLNTVGQEGLDYLSQYSSDKDLADRLGRLKVDESIKPQLYEAARSITPSSQVAMSAARVREVEAQEKVQADVLKQQTQRAGEFEKAVNQTLQNPWVTAAQKEDLRRRMETQGNAYVMGQSDDIVKWINLINQTAQEQAWAVPALQAREGQTADALMRGMQEFFGRQEAPATARQLAPIPSERGVAESFIRGTGLGEGTRLRSFIESQISDIAEDVRGKRMAWWQRVNEPPEVLPSFEEEQAKLQAEAAQWQKIAATAPTSTVAGNVQYGPGGLKAIAERAFQTAQEQLAALRPEDFPEFGLGIPDPRMKREPVRPEEDPFQKALRERRFRAEHFRRPGTGIVSRLQPAARF